MPVILVTNSKLGFGIIQFLELSDCFVEVVFPSGFFIPNRAVALICKPRRFLLTWRMGIYRTSWL